MGGGCRLHIDEENWVLLGFAGFYWVPVGFMGFDYVLLGFTEFVLLLLVLQAF